MRILHVLDHSLPISDGYSFRTHYILVNQRLHGIDVLGLTSPRHSAEAGGSEALETIKGTRYYRTQPSPDRKPGLLGKPFIKELHQIYSMKNSILSVAGRQHIDLIHAHSPSLNGLAARMASRKLGIPMVYEIRAFWEDAAVDQGTCKEWAARYRLIRSIETHVVSRADWVFTICNGLKNDLIDRGISREKITVIPNGVESDRFVPRHADSEILHRHQLHGKWVLGFIGSFYRYEGVDLLIELMDRVGRERDDLRLVLVGSGREWEAIRSRVQSRGLQSRIIITGTLPHEEAMRYYSVIDILIYPRKSIRLTELVTALKPLEAMAMEKLVVCSNVGGLRELVDDGETGVLFEAGNVEDLRKKIDNLTHDRSRYDAIRRRARQAVIEQRNWFTIVSSHVQVYKKLHGDVRFFRNRTGVGA